MPTTSSECGEEAGLGSGDPNGPAEMRRPGKAQVNNGACLMLVSPKGFEKTGNAGGCWAAVSAFGRRGTPGSALQPSAQHCPHGTGSGQPGLSLLHAGAAAEPAQPDASLALERGAPVAALTH